jgi:crotonobetainyl-CoA:carnitine CoA-transferase CaiB-like acyl-CoA transferase
MVRTLDGIRVLDLTQIISGPYGTSWLADQGAEVIKLEPPPFGEPMRMFTLYDKQMAPLFSILNRNKKSITLDLSKPESKDLFFHLVEHVDIVVENYIPGTMKKWGIDYPVIAERNLGLIYAAISGFGQTGPRSDLPAFDLIAQAAGGIMHASNITEGTPHIPFADYSSGLAIALGIMQALFYRERTGKGQFIDLSMQDLMYTMNTRAQVNEFMDKAKSREVSSRLLPTYNQYTTRDGQRVVIVTITDRQFQRLCEVMGRQDLASDPALGNTIKRWDYIDMLDEAIATWTGQHDRAEILDILKESRVPCSPVVTIDEIFQDEQLLAREMFNKNYSGDFPGVEKATIPNPVLKFSETLGEISDKAPDLGQHNEEIFCDLLGVDPADLKKLKHRGII